MPRKFKVKPPPLDLGKESIGERLARFRKEQGYTQNELAEKIGITNNLVSEYERGRLKVSGEMVARFSIALDVSTDEILGLKKERNNNVKPSLKIIRRLKKIETLTSAQQKTILKTLDLMLKVSPKE